MKPESLPCHYHSLFIGIDGYIYPCCFSLENPISHISDFSLDKLKTFEPKPCQCNNAIMCYSGHHGRIKIRKATNQDRLDLSLIYLVTTITCQAECAHCVQGQLKDDFLVPDNFSSHLIKFVDHLGDIVKDYVLMGGEVTLDPKSRRLIKYIKKFHRSNIRILSNGYYQLKEIDFYSKWVDHVFFSLPGFSEATLRTSSKIGFEKTIKFIEKYAEFNPSRMTLKYLITPINICETYQFLKWALSLKPKIVYLSALYDFEKYIMKYHPAEHHGESNGAEYWSTIIKRTNSQIRNVLDEFEFYHIIFDELATKVLSQDDTFSSFGPEPSDRYFSLVSKPKSDETLQSLIALP